MIYAQNRVVGGADLMELAEELSGSNTDSLRLALRQFLGQFDAPTLLPSIATMADVLHLSSDTLVDALKGLKREGMPITLSAGLYGSVSVG